MSAIHYTDQEDAAIVLLSAASYQGQALMLDELVRAWVHNIPAGQLQARLAGVLELLSPRALDALADELDPPESGERFRAALAGLLTRPGAGSFELAWMIARQHATDLQARDEVLGMAQTIAEQLPAEAAEQMINRLGRIYAVDQSGSLN